MNESWKESQKVTADLFGKDADVSYLTEELFEEGFRAAAETISATSSGWPYEGNSLMNTGGDNWKWRKGCSALPQDWLYYGGKIRAERLPNCTAGMLFHYRIYKA
jgi:hypothetical protein